MGLISWISKGIHSFLTPQSFKTGECFENYVRKKIFTEKYYDLLQRTYSYNIKTKNYVPSSNPDFKFRDRRTLKTFYAEVKYRKYFYKGKITWCSEGPLKHYRQCNKEAPVFIILGIGGLPSCPGSVFLIPLKFINCTGLYFSEIKKYRIHPGKVVLSKVLWRR